MRAIVPGPGIASERLSVDADLPRGSLQANISERLRPVGTVRLELKHARPFLPRIHELASRHQNTGEGVSNPIHIIQKAYLAGGQLDGLRDRISRCEQIDEMALELVGRT